MSLWSLCFVDAVYPHASELELTILLTGVSCSMGVDNKGRSRAGQARYLLCSNDKVEEGKGKSEVSNFATGVRPLLRFLYLAIDMEDSP